MWCKRSKTQTKTKTNCVFEKVLLYCVFEHRPSTNSAPSGTHPISDVSEFVNIIEPLPKRTSQIHTENSNKKVRKSETPNNKTQSKLLVLGSFMCFQRVFVSVSRACITTWVFDSHFETYNHDIERYNYDLTCTRSFLKSLFI